MQKKSNYIYLLLLMLLPLILLVVIQLFSVKEQFERAREHLDFEVSQAVNRSIYQYSVWNSHTSGAGDASSYDSYYINADSTFSFMISQSAQQYPLLDFKPDTLLPVLRQQQFLGFKEELEKTRFTNKTDLHEFYLFRTIQYCKNCTDSAKSIASIFPVDSLIKSEIKKQGVDLPVKIAFYNSQQKDYTYLNNAIDSILFNQTRFKYPFTNNEEVRILLPQENKHLLYDIFSWILSAIILISIAVFCFIWGRKILIKKSRFEEEKTNFINNVTHELKTPIATISFAVANIENDDCAKESVQIKQFTKIIKDENDRLNTQVEKVLQMASSQKQDFTLKRERVNLHEVINELLDVFAIRIKEKDSLKCELNAAHAEIKGDIFHLTNMVSNLLDNAIKYSDDAIEIVVSTESDSKGIYLKVADRGKGIDKDNQPFIFDKFYRVSSGNIYDVKGFGLGLSYVKDIVDKHQGNISVSSRIGKGTTFLVFLPFEMT